MRYKTYWLAAILAPLFLLFGTAHAVESKLATGDTHTLFIDNGAVFGMGSNNWGAVKAESTTKFLTPQFTGITSAKSITAGNGRSAALKTDGTVTVWGRLAADPNPFISFQPVVAASTAPIGVVSDIALSSNSLFYVKSGELWRWAFSGAPIKVSYPSDGAITSIAAGADHVVALYSDGTIGTYGSNAYGQLGNGSTAPHGYLIRISGIQGATSIGAGKFTSYAITSNGTVYGFGRNSGYHLGNGSTFNVYTPQPMPAVFGAKKIVGTNLASFAVMGNGTLMAAGFHNLISSVPYLYNSSKTWTVLPIASVKDMVTGWGDANMFVDGTVNKVKGWSMNRDGQLGANSTLAEEHKVVEAPFTPIAPAVTSSGSTPIPFVMYGSMNSCIKANPTVPNVGEYCKNRILPDDRGNGDEATGKKV